MVSILKLRNKELLVRCQITVSNILTPSPRHLVVRVCNSNTKDECGRLRLPSNYEALSILRQISLSLCSPPLSTWLAKPLPAGARLQHQHCQQHYRCYHHNSRSSLSCCPILIIGIFFGVHRVFRLRTLALARWWEGGSTLNQVRMK